MREFFESVYVIARHHLGNLVGFDFAWAKEIKDWFQEKKKEWEDQKSCGDKISFILGTIFELWLFWSFILPIIIYFAEIAAMLEVIMAKLYLSIFIKFLPLILFFAICYFAVALHDSFYDQPKFSDKSKIIKRFLVVLFLTAVFTVDHYYHKQIEDFLMMNQLTTTTESTTNK